MSLNKKAYNHFSMQGKADAITKAKRTQEQNKEIFNKSYFGQLLKQQPWLARKFKTS